MIKIEFTTSEIQTINYERYHHPHPRVQRKMEALWLKSQGAQHKEICKFTGISEPTLCTYLKDYKQGGIQKLKEIKFHQPQSDLTKHTQTIEAYFIENPPATIKEAMAKIEELTGIKRSETQVRKYLKSIGFERRKVGMIPAKADPDIQEEFKEEKLEPELEQAKDGTKKVYFVDAAHFVWAPFLGFLWSLCRLFIQAPAGRKRFNVLGALDAITHELITVTNDSYINAQSVCDLLWKLHRLNPNIPIVLIMDNARYQKCKLVFELADVLNIELLYLPSYSPNLNIIERLWKFIKNKCLYSKYYSDFETFKTAISDCLVHTHDKYKV
ncbi:transposase, partial [Achromatium sp. WMS3]